MDRVDCLVVGAGVVGLAVASRLARSGKSVLIAEAEHAVGTITSARNSEVIHAGIYYPKGSLKAVLCVRGRELLYEYCRIRNVPHRRVGKWIVATAEDQLAQLDGVAFAASENGVADLYRIDGKQASSAEPHLRCLAALVSPSTGIIDSHAFMLSLLGEAEDGGAMLALRCPVETVRREGLSLRVTLGADAAYEIAADWIVNCAGLDAPAVARRIDGFPPAFIPAAYYAKGSYFSLSGTVPFSRLIYPLPEPGGLGVHLTLDMSGQARFGPDVEWVSRPDYTMDSRRSDRFYRSIRTYWPGLKDGSLVPAYAGVRPKISAPADPAEDFRIEGPETHGFEGAINLFGIESPGLTSSLAIADHVRSLMD